MTNIAPHMFLSYLNVCFHAKETVVREVKSSIGLSSLKIPPAAMLGKKEQAEIQPGSVTGVTGIQVVEP